MKSKGRQFRFVASVLLALVLGVAPADAAVAYISHTGTKASAQPDLVLTSFAVSGTNPVIVLNIAWSSTTVTVSSIVLSAGLTGGTPVEIKTLRSTAGTGKTTNISVWAIPAPSGTGTITVNLSGAVDCFLDALLLQGADQTTPCPIADAVSTQGITNPLTVTAANLTANDATVGAGGNSTGGDAPVWTGTGQVETFNSNTSNVNAGSGYKIGTGSVSVTWGTPSDDDEIVAVRVAAVGGGGGGTTPSRMPLLGVGGDLSAAALDRNHAGDGGAEQEPSRGFRDAAELDIWIHREDLKADQLRMRAQLAEQIELLPLGILKGISSPAVRSAVAIEVRAIEVDRRLREARRAVVGKAAPDRYLGDRIGRHRREIRRQDDAANRRQAALAGAGVQRRDRRACAAGDDCRIEEATDASRELDLGPSQQTVLEAAISQQVLGAVRNHEVVNRELVQRRDRDGDAVRARGAGGQDDPEHQDT